MSKVGTGAGLMLRFAGRAPASFDDFMVKEPAQATVEAMAESTSLAFTWVQVFEKVSGFLSVCMCRNGSKCRGARV